MKQLLRKGAALLFLLGNVLSAAAFELPKSAVYPRIFTPNGDGINDAVYFDLVNPSLDTVEGRIFDAAGSQVADMKAAPTAGVPPLGPDALMWDGKDGNGNVVPAGVYLYELRGGGKTVTGSVVVAK